jgi:hypothetical protein
VINEDNLKKHTDHVNLQINLRYPYTNNDNNCLLFSDSYNTTNDFIIIYLSDSLRHVSAGNYGHNQAVLQ